MIMMLTLEDVTTRGEYYPDKSMATAAVCGFDALFKVLLLLSKITESTALPTYHKHHQNRSRKSCG